MTLLNDPEFWEWLNQKQKKEQNNDQEFEQIPLYISIEKPTRKKLPKTNNEQFSEFEVEYDVDTVIYEF